MQNRHPRHHREHQPKQDSRNYVYYFHLGYSSDIGIERTLNSLINPVDFSYLMGRAVANVGWLLTRIAVRPSSGLRFMDSTIYRS
jgi:hypothetical protein